METMLSIVQDKATVPRKSICHLSDFLYFFAYFLLNDQIFNQNLILDKGNLSLQKKYLFNEHLCNLFPCVKKNCPFILSNLLCHLWCNDWNQMLPEVVDQSLTSLWRNYGPLWHAVVQVPRQQSIPKPSHFHHRAWPLVKGFYFGIQCLGPLIGPLIPTVKHGCVVVWGCFAASGPG
jgi:hypothetical protein